MVIRKRKKKNKLRGNRTHGKGNTKNKRGAGSRGGRGRAGSTRHKRMLFLTEEKKKRLKPKKKLAAINLKELEKLLDKLESEKKLVLDNGLIVVDGKKLGFGKVLSRGNIKRKIKLINAKASEKAYEKIINAGGTIVENKGVKSDNQ
jgi:large subunit ribosomal protein L15